MKLNKNVRGFDTASFKDRYGHECSLQMSSLATEDCIWLGINDPKPQIMSSDATRMGLRKRTFDEHDNGWVPFEIPKEVLISTRMHLTRKQVKQLLPFLQKFAETGNLK
jgi:hypothetical protein